MPRTGAGLGTAEHQLRLIWQTSLDALLVVDDSRRYVCLNDAASRLLAAPLEAVIGSRLEDFTPPENVAALARVWEEFEREGTHHGPYEVLRGDGSRTTVEYRATRDFGPGHHLIVAREIAGESVEIEHVRREQSTLTPRELEVLQLAANGRSVRDIAEHLFLSPGTVKTHFQHIYNKLDVHDRASAVAESLRHGLIE